MWKIVAIFRIAAALIVVALGSIVVLLSRFMSIAVFHRLQQLWHRSLLVIIGVRCRYTGEPFAPVSLIVSNHISWADIMVLGSRLPVTYLAMSEVRSWPAIGWLAARVDTLFIEQGRGAVKAKREVANCLERGKHVVLFPEGRTGHGLGVRKFFPRLLQSAIDTSVPIQPVGIFYWDKNRNRDEGSRISMADAGFGASAWRTICGPRIDVEVRVFAPISPVGNREQLSDLVKVCILEHINTSISCSTSAK